MKMYVANCTQQVHVFNYRVPETEGGEMGGMRVQTIAIASQILISGDLNKYQVDAIVRQHERYGLVPIEEIDRTRGFSGVCYSIDKPVPVTKILYVINNNLKILDASGKRIRSEAAVAVNQQVENQMSSIDPAIQETLRKLEVEVKEETSGDSEHEAVNERRRVTRDEDPTPEPRRRRRA